VKKNLVRELMKKMEGETEKMREERTGRAFLKLIPTELQKAAKTVLLNNRAFRYSCQIDLLHICSLLDPTKTLPPINPSTSCHDYGEAKNGLLSSLKSYSPLIKEFNRSGEGSCEDGVRSA
jgi:hypothetical protein